MTEIVLEENDRLDWAIKSFRRKVQRSGLLKELRGKRFYLKPSAAKKLKIAGALRRKRSAARPPRAAERGKKTLRQLQRSPDELAAAVQVSPEYVNDLIAGRRRPPLP